MSLTDDYIDNREFGKPIHRYPVPASEADDQLPVFAKVGRGIRGDGYKVKLIQDGDDTTKLSGYIIDGATGTETQDWISGNISGGKLMYQYNLRPYTDPQTFTITFRLKRPGRTEWQWTTPAIPYTWDADDNGIADVDDIVGVGIASLFIKKTTDGNWNVSDALTPHTISDSLTRHEKLLYPEDWARSYLNAPMPGDPYTVNLTYGIGGDIDAPNIDDLAKLLGITVQNIRNIINNQTGQFNGSDNVKDYVDDAKAHIHTDMGFGSSASDSNFPQDGGAGSSKKWKHPIKVDRDSTTGDTDSTATSVKGYIDEGDQILRNRIKNLEAEVTTLQNNLNTANTNITKLENWIQAIINKTVGGGTKNNDGTISWNTPGNIAIGNINLYSNADDGNHIIRTHTGGSSDYDLLGV